MAHMGPKNFRSCAIDLYQLDRKNSSIQISSAFKFN